MKNLKRTIAIVCGGDSSEHDVSLRSAQGLYSFFDKERYDVYIVDVKGQDWHVELHDGTTTPIDRNDFSFMEDGKAKLFDYAYITIHGTPGENGLLQGYFDLIDLPYSTSGVLIEAMTFDKFVLNQYLRSYGVSVADSLLIRKGYEELVSDDEVEERIGMPCFVKPAADGSSFGVSKVKNKDQLAPAIRKAMLESSEIMVESYLEGTEISIGVFKTKERSVVLPATEVVTSNVGRKASNDGSTMIARTDDGSFDVKRMTVVNPKDQPKKYTSKISHVEIDLPDNPLRYTSCPSVDPKQLYCLPDDGGNHAGSVPGLRAGLL